MFEHVLCHVWDKSQFDSRFIWDVPTAAFRGILLGLSGGEQVRWKGRAPSAGYSRSLQAERETDHQGGQGRHHEHRRQNKLRSRGHTETKWNGYKNKNMYHSLKNNHINYPFV